MAWMSRSNESSTSFGQLLQNDKVGGFLQVHLVQPPVRYGISNVECSYISLTDGYQSLFKESSTPKWTLLPLKSTI